MATGVPHPGGAPAAVVGVDHNQDGRADAYLAGRYHNRDGVPDALQSPIPPAPQEAYTFDLGCLTPKLAGTWTEYLRGQNGSWEAMVRQHSEVKSENRQLETKTRTLEEEILELQRQLIVNDAIIKAGGRLQPTTLQEPCPTPTAMLGVDTNPDGRIDTLVMGADHNRDAIPDVLQQLRLQTSATTTFMVGEHVKAKHLDGIFFGATVETCGGSMYQLRWDDGDPNHRVRRAEEMVKDVAVGRHTYPCGYQVEPPVPLGVVGVDANHDGRSDSLVVGSDRNRNGILDAMALVPAPLHVPAPALAPVRPTVAAAGLDVNSGGKTDVIVASSDYNRGVFPGAFQQRQQVQAQTPMATFGLDTDLDGKTELIATGPDRNHDGMPDQLQGSWLPQQQKLWAPAPGGMFRLEQAISIHRSQVHSVAMHKDNQLIATASWDSTVKLFDLGAKSVVRTFGDAGDVNMAGLYSVAFSKTMPDILGCTSADHNVYILNHRTTSWNILTGHTNEVNGLDFHSTREVLATASDDSTCIIWDLSENTMLRTLDKHTKPVYGCVFMGDENQYWVATCSFDRNVRIFDIRNTDVVLCMQTHQDEITGLDYASSRQWLATGSDDGKISIVCARQQRLIGQIDTRLTHPENEVKRVRFSPCGNLLAAACSSGKVLVYNVSESPATLVAVLRGHADCVFDVAWGVAPDGSRMLISASHDYSCGYWKEVL